MRRRFEREIAETSWHWDRESETSLDNESIQAACLADIAKTLRRIETAINSLGYDGIHKLIPLALKQARRRERRRVTKKPPRLRVA